MILIILLVTASILVYVYVQWRYTYWKRLGVPHPEPVFFFGNVLDALTMKSHYSSLIEKRYKYVLS